MNETLKLKSKPMSEYFMGNFEIDKESVEDGIDLSYVNADGLNIEERKLLAEDLINIVEFSGNTIWEFEIPQGIPINISRLLKASYTSDISFDGSEEYFEEMKKTPANLPQGKLLEKIKNLTGKSESEISKYDVFFHVKACLRLSFFDLINENIEIIKSIQEYLPSDIEMDVHVKNEEEIQQVMELGLKNAKFTLDINYMSDLSIVDATEFHEKYNVSNVHIMSAYNPIGSKTPSTETYNIDTYTKLRLAIDKIVSDINMADPDIEKFTQIYKRLAYKTVYDHEDYLYIETDGVEGKKNPNAHNLVGVLLEGLGVCESISKALEQVLHMVEIDTRWISGDPNPVNNTDEYRTCME